MNKLSAMNIIRLKPRELQFLKLNCTDENFDFIAKQMHLSRRTVEAISASLHGKLNTKTRVGLVLYAIDNGLRNPQINQPY